MHLKEMKATWCLHLLGKKYHCQQKNICTDFLYSFSCFSTSLKLQKCGHVNQALLDGVLDKGLTDELNYHLLYSTSAGGKDLSSERLIH